MTDEGGPANASRSAAVASSAPGPLRLVAGLTIIGTLLPLLGAPPGSVYVVGTVALTGVHTWGLVRYRPQPVRLWRLVAICLWVLVLGDLVAVLVDEHLAEGVLAIGYCLGIVAAGWLVRLQGHREPDTLLDAILVTAVVGAVLWQVSLAPAMDPATDSEPLVIRLVITVLHIVGLFLVARLLASGHVPVGLWLFTVGFVITVVIDIGTTTTDQSFVAPTWVALVMVSRGALAALTLTPTTRQLVPRRSAGDEPPIRRRLAGLTLVLGGVIVPSVVAVGVEGRIELAAYVVLVPLAAAALAVRVWRVLGEHERTRRQLEHDADHDSLTGTANRRSVLRHISDTLERTGAPHLAVLFCDLDGFKPVNDRLGHAAGDECLRIMSRRLAGVLRPDDLLGRVGGDEFVLSCRGVEGDEEAEAIARRVVEAAEQPLVVADTEVVLSVSVGIRMAAPGVTAEELIAGADAAMYTAKRASARRSVSSNGVVPAGRAASIALHDPLGDAITRNELRLFLQPMCRLDTGRLTGVEVLVRWQHPQRGLLGPDAFVPLAETTGVIADLGRWTLGRACRWLAAARAQGLAHDVSIAVNISTRQFSGARLLDDVSEALEATGLPPQLLCLEITESAVFADRPTALGLIEQLQDMGVRLAVDDFGAGYSSLAALGWLPVDAIKLDRSLATSLHAFGRERAVARAAVMFGRELNLTVVAEGVETRRQWHLLRDLGCDQAQGFLLGRPSPTLQVDPPGWVPAEATDLGDGSWAVTPPG